MQTKDVMLLFLTQKWNLINAKSNVTDAISRSLMSLTIVWKSLLNKWKNYGSDGQISSHPDGEPESRSPICSQRDHDHMLQKRSGAFVQQLTNLCSLCKRHFAHVN